MTVCHYNIATYFISELSYCCASANQQKKDHARVNDYITKHW